MRKKAKLSLVLVMVVMMAAFVFAGCGGNNNPPSGGGTQTEDPVSTEKEFILVGRVAPMTGPIANFGMGSLFIEEAAVEALNAEGGIFIEEYGKKLPIKFILVDSESSNTKASEAASKLILENGIDIMITSHTADTVLPVAAQCERYQIPCISVDAPLDMWLDGGPYTYNFHAFWDSEAELNAFSAAWDIIETNHKVGLLCANDTEGSLFAEGMIEIGKNLGNYEVFDPGRFTSGTNDFTNIINQFIAEGVEIITGPVITPDFATFWKQAQTKGFIPKICAIDKANLFLPDVMSYGDNLGNGLLTEVWWHATQESQSSLTGQTSQELSDMYLEYSNLQIAPSPIGFKHANVELLVDALQRAQTLDTEKLLAAIAATDLDTIVGHIKFDENNACKLNFVVGQWVVDEEGNWSQNIVSNVFMPSIPVSGTPIAVPGSV